MAAELRLNLDESGLAKEYEVLSLKILAESHAAHQLEKCQ